jgi:hypothetical protein
LREDFADIKKARKHAGHFIIRQRGNTLGNGDF